MRRRFFLIVNPGAGVTKPSLLVTTLHALERAGAAVVRFNAADFDTARAAAREAADSNQYDAIIAAGGDGTIRNIAAALIGSNMPLGIVPTGTANVLAKEIGIAPKPQPLVRTLLEGPVTKVYCASANGEPFLLMAGAGFDARVVAALRHSTKRLMGKLAYAGPMLGALVQHPLDALSVTVDSHRHTANWAVIANARHYGGRFVIAPRTGIEQRGLQAILFKAKSRAGLLGHLMSLGLGRLDARAAENGDVKMLRCSHVTIATHIPVPTQVDGDVFGTTPLEVQADYAKLQLIVPSAPPDARHL